MNLATINAIIPELRATLIGRRLGKIFPLSRNSFAIDLRLDDSRYLFISAEPGDPRIYLIRRRMRDLEKQSNNLSAFLMQLKKRLAGFEAAEMEMVSDERIISINFVGADETGETRRPRLIVQMTGRSANVFLTDERGLVVDTLRETLGEGQSVGDIYSPPARPAGASVQKSSVPAGGFSDLSEALDSADLERKAESEFRSLANTALSGVNREIAKTEKLQSRLAADLANHGDADKWKRFGDLLLANVSAAKRLPATIEVTDYFDENLAIIQIEADDNDSVTETAEKYFRRYTKARNAREEIARRMTSITAELELLGSKRERIQAAIAARDVDAIEMYSGKRNIAVPSDRKRREPQTSSAYRTFISSDGFEILVGKKSKDNDQLTFKIAKSLDTWMHAADYPGSHVVVRNPNRKEIPPKTLLEAAQLAAFYSQGKTQPKAAVHYTQKKFVNKPKGAVPGLVSLSSFKTLLVEPGVPESVVRKLAD